MGIFAVVATGFAGLLGTVAATSGASAASAPESTASARPADDLFVRWDATVGEKDKLDYYRAHQLRRIWASSLVPGLERAKPLAPARRTGVATRSAMSADEAVQSLSSAPGLMYAEPNFKIHRTLAPLAIDDTASATADDAADAKLAPPNDPMFQQQWALTTANGIHPDGAWEITRGSRDIKVAVIDTGVDPAHVELSDRLAPGFDYIDRTAAVTDHHGHGSHVSGIIGARTNNGAGIAGINAEVTIVPIRAVPSDGDETDADVISSFEFAVAAGARVANCSFGKLVSGQAVGDTIAAAGAHGLLAVVAAGNDSQDNNLHPHYPTNFHTANMISVASTERTGALSFFSNYGVGQVDLAAPGGAIVSSVKDGGYATWSGTSMATPHVVGVAALALAANPSLTVAQLKEVILSTVTRVPALAAKVTSGGRLDATAAVTRARSLLPPRQD